METNKNIDYILDAVIARGYNDNVFDCNDFVELLQKKDFKDLIALEIYECYFWNKRHEFDLQLLKELVDMVSNYFQKPDVIMLLESGMLQKMPTLIIASTVAYIFKKLGSTEKKDENPNPAWQSMEKNMNNIDIELQNHNYILTSDIEQIFETNREEILPLLKLCGCKCYTHKKRSIWIKPGLSKRVEREILKNHNFKIK
jgi:hypothetical protein